VFMAPSFVCNSISLSIMVGCLLLMDSFVGEAKVAEIQ
jgi:hypothetical protein